MPNTSLDTTLANLINQDNCRAEFFLQLPDSRQKPDSIEVVSSDNTAPVCIRLEYDGLAREYLYLQWRDDSLVLERRTENVSGRAFRLRETGVELSGLVLGTPTADDYFYHVENPRIYSRMTIAVDVKRGQEMVQDSGFDELAGNRWADPGVANERIGASPYQPFPAILLSNMNTTRGIVHGTLSQRVYFHNYLVNRASDNSVTLTVLSSFKAIPSRIIEAGETLIDTWYLGVTGRAHEFEHMFDAYSATLRQYLPPLFGAKNHNRYSVVWGSWNDGIGRDIDQERLFKQADCLRENFPTVEWMQIDDGYADLIRREQQGVHHGLGMPYDGADAVDRNKFPDGLRVFTDNIRARGIKPAVWIGGSISIKSRIYAEHPEWFPEWSRFPESKDRVLDVSLPEVREYMEHALDVFIRDYGFDAVKQDFWSYAFEDSPALLTQHEKSGYEWRRWWLQKFRDRLPDHGYFQTGCDIVMGNPFLAEFYTNYRYGIDVGNGNWENFCTNLLWGAACFGLHIGDLFVPNSDSIGIFPELPDSEVQAIINYCLISRSLVEVGGWLYQYRDHPRMAWVRKALACPDNGQDVFFAGYDYRANALPGPDTWYIKTPHFSRLRNTPGLPVRTVAFFNLDDAPKDFVLKPGDLQLPEGEFLATDIWSLETIAVSQDTGFTLDAHASRMFGISPAVKTPALLDSNVMVTSICSNAAHLDIDIPFAQTVELVVSARPQEISMDQVKLDFSVNPKGAGYVVNLRMPNPGSLRLSFQE